MYYMAYFETVVNYQYSGEQRQARTGNGKYNMMWGNEYLFMDSDTFMGGIGGEMYDSIIELLVKIREGEV
jgi:hypothetical protein